MTRKYLQKWKNEFIQKSIRFLKMGGWKARRARLAAISIFETQLHDYYENNISEMPKKWELEKN